MLLGHIKPVKSEAAVSNVALIVLDQIDVDILELDRKNNHFIWKWAGDWGLGTGVWGLGSGVWDNFPVQVVN